MSIQNRNTANLFRLFFVFLAVILLFEIRVRQAVTFRQKLLVRIRQLLL